MPAQPKEILETILTSLGFTATVTDVNGDAPTLTWNFGDVSALVTGQNPVTHSFASAGSTTVKATISWGFAETVRGREKSPVRKSEITKTTARRVTTLFMNSSAPVRSVPRPCGEK